MAPRLPALSDATLRPFMEKIKTLCSSMDKAYADAAERAGFKCRGCSESCCEERFYHYTLAEHLFLLDGLRSLDNETTAIILGKAGDALRLHRGQDLQGIRGRAMCPLCTDGLCRVYAYRPMICRLHGIPHTVSKRGTVQTGAGCHRFTEKALEKPFGPQLDRTEFYSAMAAIEIELRRLVGFSGRYKKTVAEMVVDGLEWMDKSRPGVLL